MTATIARAIAIPDWETQPIRLRFDIPTIRMMLVALAARADRRPMPYCRSVSLGEILEEARGVS